MAVVDLMVAVSIEEEIEVERVNATIETDEAQNTVHDQKTEASTAKKSKLRSHKCSPSILVTIVTTGSVCSSTEGIFDGGAANTSFPVTAVLECYKN